MSVSDPVAAQIPYLRRFARALTGRRESGDAYVAAALEALLADPSLLPAAADARIGLYRLLSSLWSSIDINGEASPALGLSQGSGADRKLQCLSPRSREAFLLTAVEGFSVAEAAQVMTVSEQQCQELIDAACREIGAQLACEVLIIEDEPLIALDVAELVESMGHRVRCLARTHREAIEAVAGCRPGLVLADIRLADGSSGLDAVHEILRSIDVPVVFITGFPERLLTGEGPEPTYLVDKPFRPESVKALVSQALFFHLGPASGRPISVAPDRPADLRRPDADPRGPRFR